MRYFWCISRGNDFFRRRERERLGSIGRERETIVYDPRVWYSVRTKLHGRQKRDRREGTKHTDSLNLEEKDSCLPIPSLSLFLFRSCRNSHSLFLLLLLPLSLRSFRVVSLFFPGIGLREDSCAVCTFMKEGSEGERGERRSHSVTYFCFPREDKLEGVRVKDRNTRTGRI